MGSHYNTKYSKMPSPQELSVAAMLRKHSLFVVTDKRFSYVNWKGEKRYIKPDICLPNAKLVIEVDGPHDPNIDIKRDKTIRSHGWEVIHVPNSTIDSHSAFHRWIEDILKLYDQRQKEIATQVNLEIKHEKTSEGHTIPILTKKHSWEIWKEKKDAVANERFAYARLLVSERFVDITMIAVRWGLILGVTFFILAIISASIDGLDNTVLGMIAVIIVGAFFGIILLVLVLLGLLSIAGWIYMVFRNSLEDTRRTLARHKSQTHNQ